MLFVKDQYGQKEEIIISSSELLGKLVKLFDSESLDIFVTSEFLFNSEV